MQPLLPEDVMSNGEAWIATTVLETVKTEATAKLPYESGGVLLGYWADDYAVPVVTHALGPGPNARHSPRHFTPDHDFHEFEVARHYASSSGKAVYLGDWHSHPGQAGYLSELDLDTLRRIAYSKPARAPRPIMMVLAYGPEWTAVVWIGSRARGLLRRQLRVERRDLITY